MNDFDLIKVKLLVPTHLFFSEGLNEHFPMYS